MLYTLSQSHYDSTELANLLAQLDEQDALVLWQNGVLQAVRFPQLFATIPNVFVLESDVIARGLSLDLPTLSLAELVKVTEKYYPQLAL